MKEAIERLRDASIEFGRELERTLEQLGDPELPMVWAQRAKCKSEKYNIECPHCTIRQHFRDSEGNIVSNYAIAKKKGFIEECCSCKEEFLVRIHPDDQPAKIPAEELVDESKWFAVYYDKQHQPEPEIFKVVVKSGVIQYNNRIIIPVERYCIPPFNLDHFSLHRTYSDALQVAAGLWERDGTELCVVFSPDSELTKEVLTGLKIHKAVNYWIEGDGINAQLDGKFKDYFYYLGPDRDLAEKICKEKNAELEPEIDDSVLDEWIAKEEIIKFLNKDNYHKAMIQWLFDWHPACFPTWWQLLDQYEVWVQWVVDNLADEIDGKIIAALKRKLEEGKC